MELHGKSDRTVVFCGFETWAQGLIVGTNLVVLVLCPPWQTRLPLSSLLRWDVSQGRLPIQKM